MAAEQGWIPAGIDTSKANIARVYDYWLGGDHNLRADQDAARVMIAVEPNIRMIARANRAFVGRAVRFLAAEAGIRQFIDVGSGVPTAQNVHQVAQGITPGAKVIYVDNDPEAVSHSKLILEDNPDTAIIEADLRDPESILGAPETRLLIDFTQPVGLLLAAVLHFVADDDDPWQIVATLRDALPPGSYLAMSHGTDESPPDRSGAFETAYASRVQANIVFRPRGEILRFLDGFGLVDPGFVYIPQWRPDSPGDVPADPIKFRAYVGVGRLSEASG
jgi:S-adenosyl methyltransferase